MCSKINCYVLDGYAKLVTLFVTTLHTLQVGLFRPTQLKLVFELFSEFLCWFGKTPLNTHRFSEQINLWSLLRPVG